MKKTNVKQTADDIAAIWSLREELLALNWPNAVPDEALKPASDAEVSVEARSAVHLTFRVWAGYDRGGYRYPPFQFLKGGLVSPKLSELMDALARQPQLHPDNDKSGWERAFWLYQPRGRLSERALALRAAKFQGVKENSERFAAMPDVARTPAEVFPCDHQSVIDLANEDAGQLAPESGSS